MMLCQRQASELSLAAATDETVRVSRRKQLIMTIIREDQLCEDGVEKTMCKERVLLYDRPSNRKPL